MEEESGAMSPAERPIDESVLEPKTEMAALLSGMVETLSLIHI